MTNVDDMGSSYRYSVTHPVPIISYIHTSMNFSVNYNRGCSHMQECVNSVVHSNGYVYACHLILIHSTERIMMGSIFFLHKFVLDNLQP